MPRGRAEDRPGDRRPLAGQTSIDDLLKERYDLTPQLPLHWAVYETTAPGQYRDVGSDSAPLLSAAAS